MSKKIIPLGDRILVLPASEIKEKTKSGIYIPESANKERPEKGTVIAIGPGKLNEDGKSRAPISVKIGDTILFSKYGPDEIEIDGQTYLVIKEDQILAILK